MTTPTSDQLRDNIDKGQTGEKIGMPDPASVPLGTDAEAGGVSPTPAEPGASPFLLQADGE